MADGAPKVTAADIRSALKLRYPTQSHALLFEVAPGTGAGATRFADAVAVGLWPSHGHNIEGVEIKVSRSDFLHEMKQPEKSQPVFQFCDRWWLACPKGMVAPEELPPTWGLLELVGDTLRQKVKAPKLTPTAITLGFLASLARRHAGMDEEMTKQALAKQMAEFTARKTEELRRESDNRIRHKVEEAERAAAMVEEVKAATGIDLSEWSLGRDGRLVSAVKLALEMSQSWQGIASLRASLEGAIKSIDESGFLRSTS